tara:strand:- start:62 stop:1336 length:1275 start_codon:yes stop_codon:yes gene_type:complete
MKQKFIPVGKPLLSNKDIIFIFFLGFFSLLIGYELRENATGGAEIDSILLKNYVELFSINILDTLNNYDLAHSPVFYIIQSIIYKITKNHHAFDYFYIFLSSFVPIVFYFCLHNKYKIPHTHFYLIAFVIYFSPYFRASAIWSLGDNLSTLFFCLFALFFIKSENQKNLTNLHLLTLLFLVLTCYIRPIYFIFWFFLFVRNFSLLRINDLIKFIVSSFFLAIPALFYLFFFVIGKNNNQSLNTYLNLNFLEISIIALSLITFYVLPFIIHDYKNFFTFIKKKYKFFLTIFSLFVIYFILDRFFFKNLFQLHDFGGGVFYKISQKFNLNFQYIMLISAYFGFIFYYYISNKKKLFINFTLLLCLIFYSPVEYIFQKYYDPLLIIIFLTLLHSQKLPEYFDKKKINLGFIFLYFISFYIFSLNYFS